MKQIVLLILSFFTFTGCSTVPQTFSPANPVAPDSFTHEPFHQALTSHVQDGLVDYAQMAKDSNFHAYLTALQHIAPQRLPSPNHRLAFWINAYNAFAIQGIINGYSPATLMGRYSFFIAKEYTVGGETLNLYDLEQKILIPDFKEPRVHFAIVCASRSCPNLRPEVYLPETLDRQLTAAARQFINDPARNRFDRTRKIAHLSKIFDWFSEDFANHSGSLLAYVAQFVSDPDLASELQRISYTIEYLDYDWNLNGVPPSGP